MPLPSAPLSTPRSIQNRGPCKRRHPHDPWREAYHATLIRPDTATPGPVVPSPRGGGAPTRGLGRDPNRRGDKGKRGSSPLPTAPVLWLLSGLPERVPHHGEEHDQERIHRG